MFLHHRFEADDPGEIAVVISFSQQVVVLPQLFQLFGSQSNAGLS
jgi:hypothetical protein